MAEENLKLRIGADVTQAVRGINDVNKSLATLAPGSRQAAFALTNLSRGVSDLPFSLLSGNLIAVSNNIDPLIESFKNLGKEAGGLKGAMKAIGSSLLGGGGVVLAFSAVTAAITYFSARATQGKKAVEDLDKAQKEANRETGETIARLTLLTNAAADASRTTKDRENSIKAIRKEFGPYFEGLSKEAILNGDVASAVNVATAALIKKGRAQAISSKLAEVEAKTLDLQLKSMEAVAAYEKQSLKAEQERQRLQATGIAGTLSGSAGGQVAVNRAKDALLGLGQELQNLDEERKKLIAIFESEDLILDINLPKDPQAKIDKVVKEKKLELRVPFAAVIVPEDLTKQLADAQKAALANDFSPAKLFPKIKNPYGDALPGLKKFGAEYNKMMADMQGRAIVLTDVLNGTLGRAFDDLFENMISGGKNAVQSFGQSLERLIKQLISAALKAALFNAIIGIAIPGKVFAGGATSFGQGFLNSLGLGRGVANPGSQVRGNALRGEAFTLDTKLRGQDLLLSIQRTNNSNGRFY